MDEINRLHDDLLVKVLSFLPTEVAVSTSILAKRWKFLWMWLPKLEYDYCNESESERFQNFINKYLPKHKAAVIESLRLKFGPVGSIKPEDIKHWVGIAVSRCIRELYLSPFCNGYGLTKLPSSLFTCKTLVLLKLKDGILMDVPRMMKKLFTNFFRIVLEDLVVEKDKSDNLKTLSVNVPSLQKLTLEIIYGTSFNPLVINTPSLKYLKFTDYDDLYSYSIDFKDMHKLEEADIDLDDLDMDKFVRSIRFVKRLSLCINGVEEAVYHDGIVFNQLEHLKLCSCQDNWSKLLVGLLKHSPNLRELEVYLNGDHRDSCEDVTVCWQKQDLDCVPQCLLRSLETFKWTGLEGSQNEIDLVKYILRNACCLKTATILFSPEAEFKLEKMKQELSVSFQGSTTCQLVVN